MPRNPKFDPFHYVKIAPKLEKSTDRGHILVITEDGQETSVYKFQAISSMRFLAYARKPLRTDRRTDGRT